MKLKPYPKYKDSGVQWIEEVPEGWEVKKIKFMDFVVMGQSPDSEDYNYENKGYPFLQGNAEFTELNPKPVVWCETIRKIAIEQDILLSVRAPIGAINIADRKYGIGRGLCAIRSKKSFYKFLFYQLLVREADLNSIGTGSTYSAISTEDVNNIILLFPPKSEQLQISQYLDSKTSQINQTIERDRQLIDLLKEKRSALIGNIILDEKIPRIRLQHIAKNILRPIPEGEKESYTPLGLYNWGRGIFHKSLTEEEELGDSKFFFVKEGDLIISGQFAWEGAVSIAGQTEEGCVVSHRFHIINGISHLINNEYLWALFTSDLGDFLLNQCSVGSAGRNRPLNINLLMKEKIPVPSLKVQEMIKKMVHQEKELKELIKKLNILFEEFKKSLIHHVVTGKVDVREAA